MWSSACVQSAQPISLSERALKDFEGSKQEPTTSVQMKVELRKMGKTNLARSGQWCSVNFSQLGWASGAPRSASGQISIVIRACCWTIESSVTERSTKESISVMQSSHARSMAREGTRTAKRKSPTMAALVLQIFLTDHSEAF